MKSKTYIERGISTAVNEAAMYFPVICITGPRQSGKTTLINHLFGDFVRYTLEDLDIRTFAQNDPVAFLNQTQKGMALDEVQRAPELLSYIQGIVDSHPERKFILSGSSNFALLRGVSQSLAGRVGMFELLPFTLDEAREQLQNKSLDELLFSGLYPAVCSGQNIAEYYYPSYVKTYLERDVREIINVKDAMQFNTFLRLCAGRIGSVVNMSELANEVGVGAKTISAWISVLEASYVITLLRPYSGNSAKRLIKSPKIYFCDTGLACYLLDIESPAQLAHDKMRGHLFENMIVMEALKARLNRGKEPNLFFFRDSNGNEIDLITRANGKVNGFEIKSAMTFSTDFKKTISKMDMYINEPIEERGIIYAGTFENSAGEIKLVNYKNLAGMF